MGCLNFVGAQNFNLKLQGQNDTEQLVLNELYTPISFENAMQIETEIKTLQNQLYYLGYIESQVKNIVIKDTEFTAHFDLGPAYNSITIFGQKEWFELLEYDIQKADSSQHYITLPVSALENTLEELSSIMSNQSYTFATIQLQNIQPQDHGQLRADLVINKGDKRLLQNIQILGYHNFPKGFIKHFLNIKTQTPFDLQRVQNQMQLLDQLPFVQQKRPAEVLFTTDSTSVYLYLEKIRSNRFDGFLGFGSNEMNGDLEFNGYLDLDLNNNFNYGESFQLYYKSDEIDQKTLNLDLRLPYVIGSPVGVEMNLNIFKKDSTFITTHQALKLTYPMDNKQLVALGIRLASSNALQNTNTLNVDDFDNTFYEISYRYTKRQNQDLLFPIQRKFEIDFAVGQRQTEQNTQQRHIKIQGFNSFNLNDRNSIFLKFHLENLHSDNYLQNELMRFGGIRSIRGFQENSLFAKSLVVLCSEYRYRLGTNLFVHSVLDTAYFQNAQDQDYQLFGFGFGLGLRSNGGLFRLTYANGKANDTPINLSNSKVHLSFTSTF